MKRRSFVGGALAGLPITLALGVPVGRPAHAQAGKVRGTATEWSSYGGDKASSKYSPLAQIDGDNFSRLQVAWTWRSAEEEVSKANPQLRTWVVGSDAADGRRRPVCQHVALPGRCHRRGDRQDPVGLRPGDVEERNAVQQRLRASRRRLLGGWERSTHPVRHRRRLPDLPERADRQADLHVRPARAHRPDAGVGPDCQPASTTASPRRPSSVATSS